MCLKDKLHPSRSCFGHTRTSHPLKKFFDVTHRITLFLFVLTAPRVSSFTCTGYVDSATCYVTLVGTCAKISETDFTINVTVEAYLACNQSLVVHSAVVPNSSGARKEVTLKNVLPGQLYNASVVVTTSANQIVAEDRATFTTRPGSKSYPWLSNLFLLLIDMSSSKSAVSD